MGAVKAEDTISLASVKTVNDAARKATQLADEAQASAEAAEIAAGAAAGAAEEAQRSADIAAESATSAQIQLADIEKVVDTINWITTHGVYGISIDTEVADGKYYFDVQNAELTTDQNIDELKQYYTRSSETPYIYTAVDEPNVSYIRTYYEVSFVVVEAPTGNPSTNLYYNLLSVRKSISNYVASHVALDNDGLVIQTDNIKTKVRISGSGVKLTNEAGVTIATFSDSVTLGNVNGMHVVLSAGNSTANPPVLPELGFYNGATKVSYVSSDTLHIEKAQIQEQLRIGPFLWKKQSNSRISLVYAPE